MITITQITTDDALYGDEQLLRNRVLLRPIGIPDHAWEMHDKAAWHFIAMDDKKVIGCVLLRPLIQQKDAAQLFQMAVDPDYQKRGIGKMLIEELTRFAIEKEIKEIFCHARHEAVAFYEANGFTEFGTTFMEVGLLHHHMSKAIG